MLEYANTSTSNNIVPALGRSYQGVGCTSQPIASPEAGERRSQRVNLVRGCRELRGGQVGAQELLLHLCHCTRCCGRADVELSQLCDDNSCDLCRRAGWRQHAMCASGRRAKIAAGGQMKHRNAVQDQKADRRECEWKSNSSRRPRQGPGSDQVRLCASSNGNCTAIHIHRMCHQRRAPGQVEDQLLQTICFPSQHNVTKGDAPVDIREVARLRGTELQRAAQRNSRMRWRRRCCRQGRWPRPPLDGREDAADESEAPGQDDDFQRLDGANSQRQRCQRDLERHRPACDDEGGGRVLSVQRRLSIAPPSHRTR